MKKSKTFNRLSALTALGILICVILIAINFLEDSEQPFTGNAYGAAEKAFDHESYAIALGKYVDGNGMVNYTSLKSNSTELDAFVTALESLSPEVFSTWAEDQKIAFWINAYNGLTLKAIVDHYPIEPSFVASLRFPKNSIRQIPGAWDKLEFRVMGSAMTLDGIEHSRLRTDFNEPRIHVALVCAAMGCPPLRNKPFVAKRLDAQLDDQTTRFLNNPEKFRIDHSEGRVYLSSIFDWFGGDFVKSYGTDTEFKKHSKDERAVLNFISNYLSKTDADYLSSADYDIEYLDYDWSLNEQQ
jgi:hypothetical protein